MANAFVLWNRQDRDFARVGGKPLVFATSQAATDHLNTSQYFREGDLAQKPWTVARVWDVVTVTQ